MRANFNLSGRLTMETLDVISHTESCSLYEIASEIPFPVRRYIVSTPETRTICNDPFLVGIDYTEALKRACANTLRAFADSGPFPLREAQTTVLHILRGGLNFGLRDAFHDAYQWNHHSSAFISAQRARTSGSLEDWHITEGSYQKVYLAAEANIVFGDVVATGTSLEFALQKLLEIVEREEVAVHSVLFFTIGGIRSEEILKAIDETCRARFKNYQGAAVVYFEGRFGVAFPETKMRIKIPGTDLLRTEGILAPEFVESQYENRSYPLERCAIYDAGSRAFWLPEYIEDIWDYWEQVSWLAKEGVSFQQLLQERVPDLSCSRFESPDLLDVCARQVAKCEALVEKLDRETPAFKRD